MDILHKIGSGIIGALMVVGSFFSHQNVVPTLNVPESVANQTLGGIYPTGGGTYRLQTSLGSTDTSVRLSSFKEPVSGNAYTMAYLNSSIEYATLDPQTTKSEFISFSGITQNNDGTAILTGVVRGLGKTYPYSASSTLRQTHSGQSILILSNPPELYYEYAAKRNDETITGTWTFGSTTLPKIDNTSNPVGFQLANADWSYRNFFINATTTTANVVSASTTFTASPNVPTPINPSQAANKTYVDNVAIAGAPNASTTSKGIVQQATLAQLNAGTAVGSTGAPLFIDPLTLSQANLVATTTSVVPFPESGASGDGNCPAVSTTTPGQMGVIGRVFVPTQIAAKSVTFDTRAFTAAGSSTIALFSNDGGTKVFQATTTSITGTGTTTINFAATTTISSGLYYIAIIPANNSLAINPRCWQNILTPPLVNISGKNIISGYLNTVAGAGQMPATINPKTDITYNGNTTLIFRLDN